MQGLSGGRIRDQFSVNGAHEFDQIDFAEIHIPKRRKVAFDRILCSQDHIAEQLAGQLRVAV